MGCIAGAFLIAIRCIFQRHGTRACLYFPKIYSFESRALNRLDIEIGILKVFAFDPSRDERCVVVDRALTT